MSKIWYPYVKDQGHQRAFMCFSSLFLCKIMASHFHIFRTEHIKIEKKRWSWPFILMLRCRKLLSSSMVKVIEIWKTDFQQRRTKIQFKNGELNWLINVYTIMICIFYKERLILNLTSKVKVIKMIGYRNTNKYFFQG